MSAHSELAIERMAHTVEPDHYGLLCVEFAEASLAHTVKPTGETEQTLSRCLSALERFQKGLRIL
jgi:hypothetical protein